MISGSDSVTITKGQRGVWTGHWTSQIFHGVVIYEVLSQRGYNNCVLGINALWRDKNKYLGRSVPFCSSRKGFTWHNLSLTTHPKFRPSLRREPPQSGPGPAVFKPILRVLQLISPGQRPMVGGATCLLRQFHGAAITQNPQTRWLSSKFIISQFWKLVRDQGCRQGWFLQRTLRNDLLQASPPASVALGIPWLNHHLLLVLHTIFPLCVTVLCPNFPFL